MNQLQITTKKIELLFDKIEPYIALTQKGYKTKDSVFIEIWPDFNDIRSELLKIDSVFFAEIRELFLDQPHKLEDKNPFEEAKYHFSVHLNPLLNELKISF